MAANKESLRQQAYSHIHDRIASGGLRPGSVVSELSLAKEIGISRTPVREAIRQLQTEGLVEQVPRYGTIVRTPRRRELIELFQLREALESFAASLAAATILPEDLGLLERLCQQHADVARELEASGRRALDGDMVRRFLAADMAFHMLLIRAAGNGRIMKLVNDSHVLMKVFASKQQDYDLGLVIGAHQVHRQILDAVRRRDGESAREIMARHIRASLKETLARYDAMLVEGEGPADAALTLPQSVVEELAKIEDELTDATEVSGTA
ncbi:MAG: GntR family transcriptional regulator [Pirellulales bacterium]|nr:GntR family transcriptional regulator [Pirellulales bacterium]